MRKMRVKHTIYSFLWLIVWMFAVSWGSRTLTLFINSRDVNMLILMRCYFCKCMGLDTKIFWLI